MLLVDYALEYARRGFPVFALWRMVKGQCACGEACSTPGKHPNRLYAERGVHSATLDEGRIRRVFTGRDETLNIAVAVPAGYAVVDIDPRNGGDATWEAALAAAGVAEPSTVEALTGGGGRHLLFRLPPNCPPLASKLGKGIDIKTHEAHGYIVVEPSNHYTGGEYTWEASSSLLEGVEIAEMPAWLVNALATKNEVLKATNAIVMDPALFRRLRSALPYIPRDDYEDWIGVGISLKSTGADAQAFQLWQEWSDDSEKAAPLKELRRKWREDIKPDGRRGVGAILKEATARGWQDPDIALGESVAKLLAAPRIELPEETAPETAPELPRLPPGELDAVSRWLASDVGLPADAATFTAVALASAAASSRYTQRTNGAFILVGSTAMGNAARAALQALYMESGAAFLLRTQWLKAVEAVNRLLIECPPAFYLWPDAGAQMLMARRHAAGGGAQAMLTLARAITDQHFIVDGRTDLATTDKTLKRTFRIPSPGLTVFANVTPADLPELNVATGPHRSIVNAALLWESTGQYLGHAIPTPPAAFVKHLKLVHRAPPEPTDLAAQLAMTADYHEHRIPVALEALDEKIVGYGTPGLLTEGDRDKLRRMSTAIAAYDNPTRPAITPAVVEFCTAFIGATRRVKKDHADLTGSEDGKRSPGDAALEVIVRAGPEGLPLSEVARRCRLYRALSPDQRAKVLDNLVDDQRVALVKTPGVKGAGRYVAARFLSNHDNHDESRRARRDFKSLNSQGK